LKPCATILIAAAVTAAATLGGCSSFYSTVGDPFVQPGKFDFLRCDDIGKLIRSSLTREQELRGLIERANTGTGGGTVSMFVYQPELRGVEADLRLMRQTAGEKRCSDEIQKAAPKADLSPVH
jgi:hypothetical protein